MDEIWVTGDITLREDYSGKNEKKYFMILKPGVKYDGDIFTGAEELVIPIEKDSYEALKAKLEATKPASFKRLHAEGVLEISL